MPTDYEAATYGDQIAEIYDELYAGLDPGPAIDCLAELAGAGRVLELGIGTGRLALPLAARGIEVHGIDASRNMVDQLRAKLGGESLPVTIGDFTELAMGEQFDLVFVAFNTFFTLPSQEAQVRCFAAVADRLNDGGRFALELFVPDVGRYDRGQRTGTMFVDAERAHLEASRHDPVRQRVKTQQIFLRDGEPPRLYPVQIRYAWPAELDLMAQLAGLERVERWASWRKDRFTATSANHISVYAKR